MATSTYASSQREIRVMVVGDSISHGREGDWTWRYRIWEWFRQQRIRVRFVGPYKGTSPPDEPHPPPPPPLDSEPPDPPTPLRTDGGYATAVDPEFLDNSFHFAASGRQVMQAKHLVAEQVAAYQPDFCFVQLGFNDLGWRVAGPLHTITGMKDLIDAARSAKPDLKFAIADVPHRTTLPGREDLPRHTDLYNDMLATCIPHWSTHTSPVARVRFCENYSCGGTNSEAAYDGLHPNALGEYQLAQAFSRTLVSDFHLGRSELEIPQSIPARPLPTPANLEAVTAPSGIIVTWDAVYGAYGYDLQHRDRGSADWEFTHIECNRFDIVRLQKGQEIECRVRASGGDSLHSPWSEIVSAVADPQTAPPPVNMVTHATATGFTITWNPPPPPFAGEIDRYGLITFDDDQPGAFPSIRGVRGTSAELTGLTPGHRYYIAMETWTTAAGGGMPGGARPVVVGRGAPAAPQSVRLALIDSFSVELSWPEVPGAAGYEVWRRKERSLREYRRLFGYPIEGPLGFPISREEGDSGQTVLRSVVSWFWVRDWEFAVSAYNGDLSSDLSEWVTAPPPEPEQISLTETDSIHVVLRRG